MIKNPPANAGGIRDTGSIPGSGRSPRGGHGNPLQCSCLENPTDRGAWWATVHGAAQSQTRLKQFSTALLLLRKYIYISSSAKINGLPSRGIYSSQVCIQNRGHCFHSFYCSSPLCLSPQPLFKGPHPLMAYEPSAQLSLSLQWSKRLKSPYPFCCREIAPVTTGDHKYRKSINQFPNIMLSLPRGQILG